jgi:hypothetical protein
LAKDKQDAREHPTVTQALRAVAQQEFDEETLYKSVTIRIMGNGTVPYRLHEREGDGFVGGIATVE